MLPKKQELGIAALVAAFCLLSLSVDAQKRFFFNEGKFVIAQFTDLHWTPQSSNCIETAATIRTVLKVEQPDLAVLSGDVVTDDPGMEGWKAIVDIFNEAKVPFVATMGNHDAEHASKSDIYDFLLQSPWYAGEKGADEITGYGNCLLPVYGSAAKDKAEALLYFIDSNDYQPNKLHGAYDWIHFDQIEWYRKQSARCTAAGGGTPLPALAFFHIPLPEYAALNEPFGNVHEGVAAARINAGMFASFVEMGDVMGIFVGHDHDNDCIGTSHGIALAYGRVTGTDAYGSLTRGARIIRLHEGLHKFDTWIATPAGREATYYYPSGLTSDDECHMAYLPALDVRAKRHGVAYRYYEGACKHVADMDSCRYAEEGVMANFSIGDAPATDHFAYDFRTLIRIPEKGVYRFYTHSDDGSLLYLDGQLVVDNDGGHSARRAEGKVALCAGLHELRVRYFEDYMGQELEVGYAGRDIFETPLTDDMLYLPE